jgi:hypothetical protein
MSGCSRCARDTRLISAHWSDRVLCPACCVELDTNGRIPRAALEPARAGDVAHVATVLGIPTGNDPYGLNSHEHVWMLCDICGAGSMVKRGKTQPCRLTPHCRGRHRC